MATLGHLWKRHSHDVDHQLVRWTVLDPITLDQLRMLAAVVDEGSFSAAARKLQRVQSAVSTAMANLEDQLGVPLWDRRQRTATLTREGAAVLGVARRVLGEVDALRRLTAGLVRGIEAQVSLCVDAVFPIAALVDLCRGFVGEFPNVDLRLDVQTMSAVAERVVDGSATLGVATPLGHAPNLERLALAPIRMIPVVSPRHPLAKERGRIPLATIAEHVQIVLSERTRTGVPDQAVLSTRTWRVDDLHTKQALLRGGLGWGNLPAHLARADLDRGELVVIRPEAWADDEHTLHLAIVYRRDATLGPAHRWIVDRLTTLCAREAAPRRTRK
jgi:DNA-binding transcriptional LysR family regulator